MEKLDLTKQELNCYGEPIFDDLGVIEFSWELWFDADKYFGTNTSELEDSWINFYTYYSPEKDKVSAWYVVDTPDSQDEFYLELTRDEEQFLRKKMEEYVKSDLKTYAKKNFRYE